jgi:hypothetical protein
MVLLNLIPPPSADSKVPVRTSPLVKVRVSGGGAGAWAWRARGRTIRRERIVATRMANLLGIGLECTGPEYLFWGMAS